MLSEIMFKDASSKYFPMQHEIAESSRIEETCISEKQDWWFYFFQELLRIRPFLSNLIQTYSEIDSSSVHPYVEPMIRTYLIEEPGEEFLLEDLLDYDLVFKMPPKRKYSIELEVKSIKKAEPKFVEPELI